MTTAFAVAAGLVAAEPPSRAAADRLLRKTEALRHNAESVRPRPTRIVLTDVELNSFLAFDGPSLMPAGVLAPRLTLLSGGRVVAHAVVDLDAVRRSRQAESWLDPVAYLRGQLPVSAAGVLSAEGGVARVALEWAEVAGVRVPKFLLQELITFYTRSPEFPNGVGLDDPFPLPARIRSIRVDRDAAVIVQ